MKAITNIVITHAVFLTLFAGAALAFAQEEVSVEADVSIEANASLEERQAAAEAKRAEMEQAAADRQAEVAENTAERQAAVEEKRSAVQANMEERRVALQERAQERITSLAANVSNRVDEIIERVQNIIDRVNDRIGKLNKLGVDTSEAEASLASAQMSIDAAVAEMVGIDADVSLAISSEDVRSSWEPVKARFSRVRDYLKTAHAELRATVEALKEAAAEAQAANGSSGAVRNDTEAEVGTGEEI